MPPLAEHLRPLDVRVVAHTHWDREWYHAAPRFRQRLVALIDALLSLPEAVSAPFLLDGQAVVIEDYLTVRPDQASALQQRLKSGALEAGPWYVLADNLIPSGEAIVRNLLAGRRVLGRLDVQAPAVAYCPDTFGHPAALPLIANGFGLKVAIVWRGFGGPAAPRGDTFRWQAPSGESVVMYHLPPDGYETGSALPDNREQMKDRWKTLGPLLRSRSTVGVTLLQNGADHHALQPDIVPALEALQSVAAPTEIHRDSLSGFATRLLHAVTANATPLPEVHGELRNSHGYTWTLQGTFATRAAQKRDNALAERALIRDAEPWAVLAWLHSGDAERRVNDGRITLATLPSLFDVAWRELLRAHPHDTLCGCSIDDVARAMNGRLESARSQAVGLRAAAISLALHHDEVRTRSLPINNGSIVIRNRSAHVRGGVVEVVVDETLADVAVGPGSGVAASQATEVTSGLHIAGVPMQFGKSRVVFRRRESPQHYPDNDLVRAHYALAWVHAVPALGLSVHALTPRQPSESRDSNATGASASHAACERALSDAGDNPVQSAAATQSDGGVEISNGIVRVRVTGAGVQVTQGTRVVENALSFVSEHDAGDAYTPSIRGDAELLLLQSFRVVARGLLRASVEVQWVTRTNMGGIRLSATLVLDAGASMLRIDVKGENTRRNHRLRMLMRNDVAAWRSTNEQHATQHVHDASQSFTVYADAALGTVVRTPLEVAPEFQQSERVITTMPMHRWVCVSSHDTAATLHADGLAECEILRDGTVALTMLRAIGQLSRSDIVERPGHAGWPAPIPLAQSLGKFRARVGLELHDPWSEATQQRIEHASDALLLPLVGHTIRDLGDTTPSQVAGPQLEARALRMSAAKLADDNEGIVLRCINDSDTAQEGAWLLSEHDEWERARARLDETQLEPWQSTPARVVLRVSAKAVETIRVRRRAR